MHINGELPRVYPSKLLQLNHPAIATQVDSLTRIRLIERGSEHLQHMLGLARKYSDIGDRDRCMILRSNALVTIAGLLELYRCIFGEGVVSTMEELLESRQKCEELLVLLTNTLQQTMEEDGRRIENIIMVPYLSVSPDVLLIATSARPRPGSGAV